MHVDLWGSNLVRHVFSWNFFGLAPETPNYSNSENQCLHLHLCAYGGNIEFQDNQHCYTLKSNIKVSNLHTVIIMMSMHKY